MSTTALLLHRGPLVPLLLLLLLPTPAAVRACEENEGGGEGGVEKGGGEERGRAECVTRVGEASFKNGFQKLLLKKRAAMYCISVFQNSTSCNI